MNLFRYRGYCYNTETGLYYLQTRYYDPSTERFINADGIINKGVLGPNIYLYCLNSPVGMFDSNGDSPWGLLPYPGFIHNAVVNYVSNTIPGMRKEVPTGGGGRMDLFLPYTREIWEVKPFGSMLMGIDQLNRYISELNGYAAPGGRLGKFEFKYEIFWVNAYSDNDFGIIQYSFTLDCTEAEYKNYMQKYPDVAKRIGYPIPKDDILVIPGSKGSSRYKKHNYGYNYEIEVGASMFDVFIWDLALA